MDRRLFIRVRTDGERRAGDGGKIGESLEMAEDQRGVRRRLQSGDRKLTSQESSGARGVDQQISLEANGLIVARSPEVPAVSRTCFQAGQLDLFDHLDARRSGLKHEMVIDVRAQPVRVRDGVRGAGGDEHAVIVGGAVGVGAAGRVAVEGEAPLEPAAEMGEPFLPASPGGEGVEVVRDRSVRRGAPGRSRRAAWRIRRGRNAGGGCGRGGEPGVPGPRECGRGWSPRSRSRRWRFSCVS